MCGAGRRRIAGSCRAPCSTARASRAGPPGDATAAWMRQLYVLYVYAADHGTGAGRALLEAVIDPAEPAALWVADPSPRAQAFYRKHGLAADGTARFEDGGAGDPHGPRRVARRGRPLPGNCRRRNGLMTWMTLPWAAAGTLINSLPLAGSDPGQRFQNRSSAAGMRGSWKLRHGRAPD